MAKAQKKGRTTKTSKASVKTDKNRNNSRITKATTKITTPSKTIKSKAPKKSPAKSTKTKKKKAAKRLDGFCFVLMPFKEPFNTYYATIIKPAVTAAGLESRRGDSLFRPSPIMNDIWAMIQDAKVLVAELTEKNANVFYELGLGHAIGKPIILISETIDDVPFDLQPLRVILYDKDDPAWGNKLRLNLISSLGETTSDPTSAVPPMFRKKVESQAPKEAETSSRLAALERQVASLRSSDLNISSYGTPRLSTGTVLSRFKRKLQKAMSREEAVDLTVDALRQGFSENLLRDVMRDVLPVSIADDVLKLALSVIQHA